jgi:F0F1-type ATP synthase assembly protein I
MADETPDSSRSSHDAQRDQAAAESPGPKIGDLLWIGTACAISVVGAGAIGWELDNVFGTAPWLVLGGLAFGILCAVLLTWAQIRRFL